MLKCCDGCRYVDRMWKFKDYVVCKKRDKHVLKNYLCEEYEHRKVVVNPNVNRGITR